MFSMNEEGELGYEDAISWLPSHVIDEACNSKARMMHMQQQTQHYQHHYPSKLPAGQLPMQHHKSYRRAPLRPRYPANWASRGPGMQAIFLDSGTRTCGTGVFLPQTAGTKCQPNKKPACSPVLLPSRVVQALNLNVHDLGLQISPKEPKNCSNVRNSNAVRNNNSKNVAKQSCLVSQNQNTSPEIFLPKEWTY